MSENMVRTQVYLPRDIYNKLQHGEKFDAGLQIRTARRLFDRRKLKRWHYADDPIFKRSG